MGDCGRADLGEALVLLPESKLQERMAGDGCGETGRSVQILVLREVLTSSLGFKQEVTRYSFCCRKISSAPFWVVNRRPQQQLLIQLFLIQPLLFLSLLYFLGSICHQSTQSVLYLLTCLLSALLN